MKLNNVSCEEFWMWIDPSGHVVADGFISKQEAEEYPVVEENWTLVGFDEEGNEL